MSIRKLDNRKSGNPGQPERGPVEPPSVPPPPVQPPAPRMDRRKLVAGLAALLLLLAVALGLTLTRAKDPASGAAKVEVAATQKERLKDACGSNATYARLKEIAFEEAIRVRNADPANLDTLANHSVVRMENPVVKSRDDKLNVTVCSGRFVLELPPGAERAFGGQRRLVADIEYAAQAAADGSGLVYRIEGAEPIVYKLAAFDLQRQRAQPAATADGTQLAEAAPLAGAAPIPADDRADEGSPVAIAPPPAPVTKAAPQPVPRSEPEPEPEPRPVAAERTSRPSFNCRNAGTRSERMVCSSDRLAGLDRAMLSQFYSALARSDGRTRRALRQSRDRFLAYRERCRSEACIADAYEGRMMEIRDIASASE